MYRIRDLEPEDLNKGFLELLGQLTVVGEADQQTKEACLKELLGLKDIYKTVVVEGTEQKRIVATAKLVIERKLTRSCGKCGHIEDVVVDNSCRGQKLGQRVINALIQHARDVGCYKVILDCSEQNIAFYEKCGLERKEVQMEDMEGGVSKYIIKFLPELLALDYKTKKHVAEAS